MFKLLIYIAISLQSFSAIACSCAESIDIEFLASKAEHVFIGRLKSKNSFYSFGEVQYKFATTKMLKGKSSKVLEVVTDRQGSSCGLDYSKGSEYIVFAFRDLSDDSLKVDKCSSWLKTDAYMTERFNEYYKNQL